MTELGSLYVTLCVLYLVQCLHWVEDDTVVFRRDFRRLWHHFPSGLAFAAFGKKVVVGHVLPWAGQVVVISTRKFYPSAVGNGRESIDIASARTRIHAFNHAVRPLALLAAVLSGYILVVIPLLFSSGMVTAKWPYLLAVVATLEVGIVVSYWRVQRTFFPADKEHRWTSMISLILYLPAAMRAEDLLTTQLLKDFHPVAAANVLCPERGFQGYAEAALRRSVYPLSTEDQPMMKASAELQAALLRVIQVEADTLLGSPSRSGPDCVSYCPRCKCQFTRDQGDCADCAGVALVRF